MRKFTVGQLWPLLSGSTNQPTLTPGQQAAWQFQDVPDRAANAPLANYLPGVRLTFSGNVVQAGGTGANVWSDQFFACLFSSLAWIQAWHGSALQAQHVTGAQWNLIEYFANGFRYESNVRGLIAAAANNTYPFEITIFVPFNSCRIGDLEANTSQLALLARASQLQVNVAPASVLTAISPGGTITNFKARASAILVPRQELVLGTPIETILTQIVAGSGNAVKITNFGTDSGLQGVDPGGGVLSLNFLSSQNNQGGSYGNAALFQDFTFPWRGQNYTQDMLGLLQAWKRLLPDKGPSFNIAIGGNTVAYDLFGVPYSLSGGVQYPATSGGAVNLELLNLLYWSLVAPGPEVDLTALQTADSDQTFNLTPGGGGYTGTHQILGQYARSWQKGMRDNWVAQVMAGGSGSLAAHVLGSQNVGKAQLARRAPAGKHVLTQDESRYLPWQLVA